MAKASSEEAMIPGARAAQASGSPKTSMPGVSDTLPEGMKAPSAPGESSMGGVKKGSSGGSGEGHMGNSSFGAAISQLNYETERGEHAPGVGGHADAGQHHTGVMKKA
jgi:hypothetical protein